MLRIDPKELPVPNVHAYLLGGVAPRPIALVSTVSESGRVNLSPFSFFNAFGANPPVVVFSPSRRGRDGSLKDTYNNIVTTKECVIQAVTYDMVQQVSLASTEYDTGVDEFVKSGLTPVPSELVKAPRVKESPFQMECKLLQMIPLGEGGAAGNLAVCEVMLFHVAEEIVENGVIQPDRIDLVARMGANFYTRARGESVFEVAKPIGRRGIGYDQLPDFIKNSHLLTANNLAQLGNVESLPSSEAVHAYIETLPDSPGNDDPRALLRSAAAKAESDRSGAVKLMFEAARKALDHNDVDLAWHALLYAGEIEKK